MNFEKVCTYIQNFLQFLQSITYIQISTSIPTVIRVPWPEIYIDFLKLFEFVNLDLVAMLGMKCLGGEFWDFRAKILSLFTVPLVFIAICLARVWYSKVKLSRLDRNSRTWRNIQVASASYLFDIVDHDQSGNIELPEFVNLLHHIEYHKSMEDSEVESLFREMGGSNQEDFDEHGHPFTVIRLSRDKFISDANFIPVLEKINVEWAFTSEFNRIWSVSMSHMLIILFLMHAPISKMLFAFFACHNVGGRNFLRAE